MAELDPKIIEELKAKHGEVRIIDDGDEGDFIIVRRPTKAECRAFMSAGDDPRRQETAAEDFVRSAVVYPSKVDFAAMIDRRYMLVVEFVMKLKVFAGMTGAGKSNPL